jgi:3-deoxy-D-manno-octulosonic-acid transferase
MILFFYNLALIVMLVVGSPWWILRILTTQKYREGLMERLGRVRFSAGTGQQLIDPLSAKRPLLWVHAVSVGEVLAVTRLVKTLDAELPEYFVAVSTTTRTGQALARERFGANRVFYCPLDLPWAVNTYLNALQPRMLILAETEFWPNLLSGCFRRKIPVTVVNARISDRSWPRYFRLRALWKPLLLQLSSVLAQSKTDAERLKAIGCQPERVSVAGNLKFDVRVATEAEATQLLKALALRPRFLVAGSTLEGEEAALLAAMQSVWGANPYMILVLAPRHPERFDAVAELLDSSRVDWVRRSAWKAEQPGSMEPLRTRQVVLLDTIGELASVYSLAMVAFVGGSLVPAGGHNPLEPAQFGVPIVMGPHYANFRSITEDLIAQDAIRITERGKLTRVLVDLISAKDGERDSVQEIGARARKVFESQAGATERTVTALRALLAGGNQGAQP